MHPDRFRRLSNRPTALGSLQLAPRAPSLIKEGLYPREGEQIGKEGGNEGRGEEGSDDREGDGRRAEEGDCV